MFSLLKLLWLLHNGLTLRYCEGRRSRSQMEVILLTRRVLGVSSGVSILLYHSTGTLREEARRLCYRHSRIAADYCFASRSWGEESGSLTGIVQSAYGNVFLLTWRFLYWRPAILLAKLRVVPEYPPWNKRPSFKVQQVKKSNHNLEC